MPQNSPTSIPQQSTEQRRAIPTTMSAVLLTGHGGLDALEYRTDVVVPTPGDDEVLIEVSAAGVNNTDINTRIGWYSKSVSDETEAGASAGFDSVDDSDAGWAGEPLAFPRVQGADVCGRIRSVGSNVSSERIGERVLVRNMLRSYVDYRPFECWTFGSECDGGFAQFTLAPAQETYAVDSELSDVELAAIPCAYSTAENMLSRADVKAGERILVVGASGGVGLAAVQLAARRGATVLGVSSPSKAEDVRDHGADEVIDRHTRLVESISSGSLDTIIDVVGGPDVGESLTLLRRGGTYAVAGAIGGPMTEIDLRTVYLKDLSLLGCTFQEDSVFADLVAYIERSEIRPLVSKTYPLSDIRTAQEDFSSKTLPGKLVLLPPTVQMEGQ